MVGIIKQLKYNEFSFTLYSEGTILVRENGTIMMFDVGDVPIVAETLKDLVGEFVKWKKSQE